MHQKAGGVRFESILEDFPLAVEVQFLNAGLAILNERGREIVPTRFKQILFAFKPARCQLRRQHAVHRRLARVKWL